MQLNNNNFCSTVIPSTTDALGLIGGQERLDALCDAAVDVARREPGLRISLAINIARSYFKIESPADLEAPLGLTADNASIAKAVHQLNTKDGPLAAALSRNLFAWKPIIAIELAALATQGDFVDLLFLCLR